MTCWHVSIARSQLGSRTTGWRSVEAPSDRNNSLNPKPKTHNRLYTAVIVAIERTEGPVVRPLKVGVQLPEVEYEYTWPQLAEMATVAEHDGLDSIWLGDHLMYRYQRHEREPRGPFEAWTTLAPWLRSRAGWSSARWSPVSASTARP